MACSPGGFVCPTTQAHIQLQVVVSILNLLLDENHHPRLTFDAQALCQLGGQDHFFAQLER